MRSALLLLALPVALAACGSGSKDAGSPAPSTSTAAAPGGGSTEAFVAAGNRVCIRADRRVFAIGRLSRDPRGWARTAASARRGIREMSRVRPPAARAAPFRLMVQLGGALALSIQQVHDALVKQDYETASAAQLAAAQLQDRVHVAARRAGLTFCQQSLTNWPA